MGSPGRGNYDYEIRPVLCIFLRIRWQTSVNIGKIVANKRPDLRTACSCEISRNPLRNTVTDEPPDLSTTSPVSHGPIPAPISPDAASIANIHAPANGYLSADDQCPGPQETRPQTAETAGDQTHSSRCNSSRKIADYGNHRTIHQHR